MTEVEDWTWETDSTPLEAVGDGPCGFVGAADKHSCNEGENCIVSFGVVGNPPPDVVWMKGFKPVDAEEKMRERFKPFTRGGAGERNVIGLFIKEARTDEEGDYRVQIKNEHGEEEYEFKVYVTVAGGMDFRAMLIKKKKKKAPPPAPPIEWIETPVDVEVQEKKDDKAMFGAKLSEKGKVGRWFLKNERTRDARTATEDGVEITKKDSDYEIAQVDDCYTLTIKNPTKVHAGRYTLVVKLDKDSKFTSALLNVSDADPEFFFKMKLDEEAKGLTNRPLILYTRINMGGANVKWLKNGQNVALDGGRIEFINKKEVEFNLKINSCTMDDAGLYTAILQEFVKPGEDSECSCIVNIEEYPHTFTSQLKGQDVQETDEATFEIDCEAEDAEVTWYQNGKPIKEDDPRFTIIKKGKKRIMKIKSAQLSDTGKIEVRTNVDKSECQLNVKIENKIIKGLPATHEVVERESAEFIVELRDPTAPVEFFINGMSAECMGDRMEVENLGGGKHKLKVKKWAMSDDGEIEMRTPSNRDGGTLTSTMSLGVIKGECVPTLGDVYQGNTCLGECGPVVGIAHDDASWNIPYKCEGVQQSPLEVVVIKDGRELVIGKDINVNLANGKIDLSVINPTRSKSGIYTVVLRNAQGEVRKDINVDILDKPTPPRNVTVSDVFYDNCIVHWKEPADDGGCPITHYIVEAIDMTEAGDTSEKSAEWYVVGDTPSGNERQFYCPNLRHRHTYKFRVRAVNRLGKSDPAALANGVLIKDPWDEPDAPGRPTCLDWGPQSCDLEWPPPESDGGAPITHYEIEFLEKGPNEQWAHGVTIPVDELKMVDGKLRGCCPGLIEGCDYQFRIKAINKGGPSLPSPPSEPPITAMNRFIAPFVKQPGMHDITIKKGRSFSYDLWFGGEPAPSCSWFRKEKGLCHDPETTTIELICKNSVYTERNSILTVLKSERLRDTGKYTFRLESSTGVCEASGFVNVLDVPGPPRDFSVKQVFPDKVSFSWQPPEDDGGQPIKHYQIRMMDFDTGEWTIAGDFDGTTGTVTGLKPGKCYEFEIVAVNKEGESPAAKIDEPVFTLDISKRPGPPLKPGVVDYERSKALLEWTKPLKDGGYPITHYKIEKKECGKDSWCEAAYVPIRDCEQVDDFRFRAWLSKLQNGKWYEFRVFAENRAGLSDPSESSDKFLCRPKDAAPCIDKSLGGPRITRENRSIDWRILITGHPTPDVRWTKADNPIDDHRVVMRSAEDMEGLVASLNIAKCKKSDAGLYKLTAENALGSDSLEIDLIVLDDLDGCECAMFSTADLACTCRHRRLDMNVKQLLQDFGLQMEIEMLMNNAGGPRF